MAEAPRAKRSEIPAGTTRRVETAGGGILICNVAGTFYAIEDLCSHDLGEMDQSDLEDCRIMCPRHGAYFDVTTGAALTLPAVEPIRTFSVRVDGDEVVVEV